VAPSSGVAWYPPDVAPSATTFTAAFRSGAPPLFFGTADNKASHVSATSGRPAQPPSCGEEELRMDEEELRMDKALVEMLARAAGLDKALADHPADVFGAAEQALNTANAIRYPTDPAAEPWPPMRAESQA
jgi:hypothetical protein